MSTKSLLLIIVYLLSLCTSQEWNLIWSDEFNGNELNTSNWANTRHQSHSYPYEMQIYTASNVYLSNGNLVLRTKYDPTYDNKTNTTYPYTSGVVTSESKFYFTNTSKIDIRAKLPTEQFKHAWPALWLQKESGSCYQEIDIMEQWIGHDYNTENTASCGKEYSAAFAKYPPNGQTIDFSKDFHIWSLIWNNTDVTLWIDNNFVGQLKSSQAVVPYEPEYIIFNTAVCGASYCGGTSGIPKDVTAYLYVDYVRVYKPK